MREQHGPMREPHGPYHEGQRKLSFGNYDLVRRIDVGGMGEVYLARQRTAFNRLVAIKIIRSDLVHDPIARQRFLREAEVNSKLLHEHIPALIEFNEDQGQLFFVTPYISGGTLANRLQTGPLTLQETYQLFTALLSAVAYIHRHGVVHRDLKPSNILLDTEMEPGQVYVRLIDFGIASDVGNAADPRLTQAGTEMGTVIYMAPERLSGVSAPSNDIYSLGMILHQMLTGHLPSAARHVSLPASLEYVINRCIAQRPEDRFATAEEALKAFEYAYQCLSEPQPVAVIGASAAHTGAQTSLASASQEVATLRQSDQVPSTTSQQSHSGFPVEDYASPTVDIHLPPERGRHTTGGDPATNGTRPRKHRRSPLFAIIPLSIFFVLLAMAVILLFTFQAGDLIQITASINIGPQVHSIHQVYQMKASLSQTSINTSTNTIPLHMLNSSKSGSQTGQTTGRECLIPPFIDCQQVVSQTDVNTVTTQLQQTLDQEITQDLQQQLGTKQATQVGSVQIISAGATANPPVGTPSKTVTVTINGQQGKMVYYQNSDAQSLARTMLARSVQKLGANYHLLQQTEQIGSPVVVGVDSSNNILIDVPAGGVAEYKFPPAQLQQIASAIKGVSENNALAYLKRQPGVDPSTVTLHISSGHTMPGNAQDIKIITVNPTTIPPVVLPRVTPGSTATLTPSATASPTQGD